jgi:hypothetical protein
MPGILPFIPLIAAGVGLVGSNVQNKNNQAAQQNAANSAQKQVAANTASAQSNLAKWNASNPSPASTAGGLVAPKAVGQTSFGGGTLGPNGQPGGATPSPAASNQTFTPQMIQQLLASLSGGAGAGG